MRVASDSAATPTRVEHPERASTVSTADALMVLTSFEAYDYQRRLLGHDLERIHHGWHSSFSAQLTPLADAE